MPIRNKELMLLAGNEIANLCPYMMVTEQGRRKMFGDRGAGKEAAQ